MIPRVAKRGHSFKGAGLYYLHDKQETSDERVVWTYTHNLPTDDPHKAMNYMAYTAMNAERLKGKAGVARTGRKSSAGAVYSFSLAWHPEQEPDRPTMQNSALEVLQALGLHEHEAVFVSHNDRPHPHVHVVCNLVHPEHGKTAVPSYDYLTHSRWAEKLERADGKIYCEERVINNEKRKTLAKENRQLALVKHREEKLKKQQEIEMLYNNSDSPKAFQAALQDAGYTLAHGDRRGFVLVNDAGEIASLSRQLKGQRAKDIKERLADLKDLPNAKELQDERQHFDRDKYEAKRQMKIVDAAIENDEEKRNKQQRTAPLNQSKETKKTPLVKTPNPPKNFAEELDKVRDKEAIEDKKQAQKEEVLTAFYNREVWLKKRDVLQKQIQSAKSKSLTIKFQEELDAVEKTLGTIEQRMNEQNISPEKTNDPSNSTPSPEEQRAHIRKQFKRSKRDRNDDFDLER